MPENNMDATLQATFEKIEGREQEKTVPVEKSEPVKTEAEIKPETPQPAEKQRDQAGRFTQTDVKPDAPKDVETPKGESTAVAKAGPPQKAPTAAPSSLSPAVKAIWDTLAPEIRQEFLRRDNDHMRSYDANSAKLKQYDALDQTISPYRDMLVQNYGNVENGLRTLFSLSDFANKNPVEFAAKFLMQRGVDLNQFINQIQRGGFQAPQQAALNPLEERLRRLEQERDTSQTQAIEGILRKFVEEKDGAGNPAHPHFEELRNEIAAFLDMGLDLQDAYDRAVWASPTHREGMLQSKNEQAEAQRKAELEQQAKAARQASVIASVTKPNAGTTPSKPKSWEDTLSDTYSRIKGRGAA